jgi:hypothetical protein
MPRKTEADREATLAEACAVINQHTATALPFMCTCALGPQETVALSLLHLKTDELVRRTLTTRETHLTTYQGSFSNATVERNTTLRN